MATLDEFEVVQNEAVGALALYSFVSAYYEGTERTRGPTVPVTMPVLPMVFHRETVEAISTKNYKGGLFRALAQCESVPLGLQHRMEAMVQQTFRGINLALAVDLIRYDRILVQLSPARKNLPNAIDTRPILPLLATATRLGNWFATLTPEQIAVALKLTF